MHNPTAAAKTAALPTTTTHLQEICCLVEVQDAAVRFADQIDELLGEHPQAAVVAARRIVAGVGGRRCWVLTRGVGVGRGVGWGVQAKVGGCARIWQHS